MPKEREATLATGATTLTVSIDGNSQIGLTGTFGTVTLTDPEGAEIRTADTAAASFASEATEMVFTLTVGAGPVLVTVRPTRVANISKFEQTA